MTILPNFIKFSLISKWKQRRMKSLQRVLIIVCFCFADIVITFYKFGGWREFGLLKFLKKGTICTGKTQKEEIYHDSQKNIIGIGVLW